MMTKRLVPIAAALAVALAPAVASASPQVSARLSAPEVEVGQAAQLAVTVAGADAQPPRVARVPGLSIQPMGSSQQMTITNGAIDQRTTYHYQVVPQRTGSFIVGPISVGGAQAAPLSLSVRQASAQGRQARPRGRANAGPGRARANAGPGSGRAQSAQRTTTLEGPPGRRAFLVVDTDEKDLVVGESTPITVRAYVKAGTSGTITGAPELSSDAFAIHDLVEDAQQGRAEIRGTPYATLTWRGKMTALLPGEHDLSASVPATLEWRERVRVEREDPFRGRGRGSLLDQLMNDPRFGSAFDDPFFSGSPFGSGGGMGSLFSTSWGPARSARVSLEDGLGTVTVREPPEEGRPDDWDGAVGRFEVSAEATPTTARAGEPITLRLRVSGEGSFERVHHDLLPDGTDGVRTYPVTEHTESADGRTGEKVFEQSLVPTEAGPLTLPAFALSFYDPERGEYVTARTEPIAIEVQPSADGEAPVVDLEAAVGPSGHGFAPNAITPGAFVGSMRPVPETPWPWLAVLLAMSAGIGAAVALRRRDADAARTRKIRRRARRDLRAARKEMREAVGRGDAAGFFLAARTAAQRRLGEAWGVAPEAVTLAEAEARHASVPPALSEALERADAVEFAGAAPADALAHEQKNLEEWLRRVEGALDEEIDR